MLKNSSVAHRAATCFRRKHLILTFDFLSHTWHYRHCQGESSLCLMLLYGCYTTVSCYIFLSKLISWFSWRFYWLPFNPRLKLRLDAIPVFMVFQQFKCHNFYISFVSVRRTCKISHIKFSLLDAWKVNSLFNYQSITCVILSYSCGGSGLCNLLIAFPHWQDHIYKHPGHQDDGVLPVV